MTKRKHDAINDIIRVEDILAQSDVEELALKIKDQSPKIKVLISVVISHDGEIDAQYAGPIGDITAIGLLAIGSQLITDGLYSDES